MASLPNPYNTDLKDVKATAILYDSGGKVIGGNFTEVTLLPTSGTTAVSITIEGPPPAPAKVLIYASVSSLKNLGSQKR